MEGLIPIEISDDETINTDNEIKRPNTNNDKEQNSPPNFYCVICNQKLSYDEALIHIRQNKNKHDFNSIISEKVMEKQENDIIIDIMKNLEDRNNEINDGQKMVVEKVKKINDMKKYIYRSLEIMKEENDKYMKMLKEEKEMNDLIKEKICLFIKDNKNKNGVMNKYNKLRNFKILQLQLNNNYFDKNIIKDKNEEMKTLEKAFINKISSEFNIKEKNEIKSNNNKNNNAKESIQLKEELKNLNVKELKAINDTLDENDNSFGDIIIEINANEINWNDIEILKTKRKRSSINIDE